MAEHKRDQITRWTAAAVAKVCEELRASAPWPATHRDKRERGWERLQADSAFRLGRLARAAWNGLTLAEGEAAFLAAAPTDAGWTHEDVSEKWRVQHHRKGPAPYPAKLATEDAFISTLPQATVLTDAAPTVGVGVDGDEAEDDPHAVVFRRFPRLDLAALLTADRPPREWVIGGLIPAGASVALVAPAGTGKSLLLLASMIAVARGQSSFAGLPITPRRVLLIDAENTEDDLADRLAALGVTPDDVKDLDQLVTIHLPPLAPLDTAVGGLELGAILDAYDVRAGGVLVLDSLQRVIHAAENDSDTMRAYYRHTAIMLKRRGLTVG